jgi:hypothetical protein
MENLIIIIKVLLKNTRSWNYLYRLNIFFIAFKLVYLLVLQCILKIKINVNSDL